MRFVLKEGLIQITVNQAITARKFDGADHGLSHCMKAVDFIIELPDRYLFIELKDPSDSPPAGLNSFLDKLKGNALDSELVYKYRDSFLYEQASGRAERPVHFLVLIALDVLDKAALMTRKRQLDRKLPLRGPQSGAWPQPIVASCGVFNLRSWNERFPEFPVERL